MNCENIYNKSMEGYNIVTNKNNIKSFGRLIYQYKKPLICSYIALSLPVGTSLMAVYVIYNL